MTVLAASLTALLLVTICSMAGASPRDSGISAPSQKRETNPICCFTYTSHPIPFRMILSAYRTSNICPQPAVVLVTSRGIKICANPEARWVQKYLKRLELPV